MSSKPFISYIRVSDTAGRKGSDSYGSPDEQRRDNEATAARFTLTLGREIVHEDVSGGNVGARLAPVLAAIRADEVGGIVVRFFDRFSRDDVLDSLNMVRSIREAGGEVYASNYSGPVHEDDWQAFADAKASYAYRERIRLEWKAAKRRARERGAYVGRTGPGYTRNADGTLAVNEQEAPLVRAIFARKLRGDSYAELARYAQANGLPKTTTGGIRTMLRNPVYVGKGSGGTSPVLVDAANFDAVQAMMKNHKRKPTGRGAQTLCQGLARCANCGSTLVVYASGMYYCRGLQAGGCDARGCISIRRLDQHVQDVFLSAFADGGPLAQSYADASAVAETAKLRAEASHELEQLKGSTSLVTSLGIAAFEEMIGNAAAKLAIAEQAHQTAKANSDVLSTVASMIERWQNLTMAQKRRLVAVAVERITVGNGRGVPVERKAQVLFGGGVTATHTTPPLVSIS